MAQSLDALFWRASDILRRDDNTQSLLDYVEQISWLLFLKSFEDLEDLRADEADYRDEGYDRIIAGYFRWSVWTRGRVQRAHAALNAALAEERAAEKALLALEEQGDSPTLFPLDPEALTEARQRLRAAKQAVAGAQAAFEQEKESQQQALKPLATEDAELAAALQEGATGKPLLDFLGDHLFPNLRELDGSPAHAIVRQLFEEPPSKIG